MSHFLQTAGGRAYDLEDDPDPSAIQIEEIAFALAHINRFLGHAGAYSVAQHSVLAMRAAEMAGLSPGVCAAATMHDAHEALTGDCPTPIKRILGDAWRAFERRHEIAIRRRFGICLMMPSSVVSIDLRMLVTERRDLLGGVEARSWGIDAEPFEFRIVRWSPETARREFLAACEKYGIR
tara:strand:- start:2711 stop:3250 length:540 start_codon:yes stop_codon:yes gene_type:complete